MQDVKRIFFLTKDEAVAKREETGNSYITHTAPHYELENGTVIWAQIGYPASSDIWWGDQAWQGGDLNA